jgi:outer membrane lipopolysaccharide assembly protein LptE/RlpB
MGLFLLLLAWLMATFKVFVMAACAWNLRKWLVIATIFLFWQKLGLFFVKYIKEDSYIFIDAKSGLSGAGKKLSKGISKSSLNPDIIFALTTA